MKTGINNSAKRVLSLVLAFAMLVGTLFVANVGVNIRANAETAADYSTWNIQYWEGGTDNSFATGDGSEANPFIITNAKELNWVATVAANNAKGLKYIIDPDIDAFIMQPQATVTALGGPKAFIEISSAEETRKLFEETAKEKGVTLKNWQESAEATFAADIDGSGVPIYGVYDNAAAKAFQSCAFFPSIDGGGTNGVTTLEDDNVGSFVENIVIRNSYFKGIRRVSALASSSYGSGYGAKVDGQVNIDACEVANCFLVGQNLDEKNSKLTFTSNGNEVSIYDSWPDSEMAVFLGSMDNDPAKVTNCLIYGNDSEYRYYSDTSTYTIDSTRKFNRTIAANRVPTNTTYNKDVYGEFHKSIVIGATISGMSTNTNEITYTSKNYTFYDVETIRGASAMVWAEALEWGTEWFAVEGGLPTPIEPASYIPADQKPDNKFAGGAGTKAEPYIIRSVDQLYQMVNEQSYSGTYVDTHYDYGAAKDVSTTSYYSKYYKVADDVESLYINKAENQADIVDLASSSTCNVWAPTASFFAGNFDGNGVTIYGMISKNGKGFVNKIDGTHAAIKNVHFKAAYVNGGDNRAAVVTTSFGSFGHGYKATADATQTTYFNRMNDPNGEDVNRFLIANIAVTESYIHSNLGTDSDYVATAGGIISLTDTPPWLYVRNCFFDGVSSTLTDGVGTTAGANTTSMKAGIATMPSGTSTNRWNISNCISINEYPVSMKTGGDYGRLNANSSGGSCEISNMYGPVNAAIDTTKYPKFGAVIALETKNAYAPSDATMLDWANIWNIVDVKFDEDGNATRSIPMPIGIFVGEFDSYSQILSDTAYYNMQHQYRNDNYFGMYTEYTTGSGKADDPYIIKNDVDLARAIACGGKNLHQKLYYKLACDIELKGLWLTQASIGDYRYVPFEGTIDGAGYTISGFSATDATAAGFIPVLNGGTVKNLHFRNCYAGSVGVAGIIAGQVNSGTITGCSVEGGKIAGSSDHITGNNAAATITDSYYLVDGEATYIGADISDLYSSTNTDAVWYKVGDSIARHTSFAKAHSVTDVDGDGVVEEKYVGNDITALRNFLLKETGYDNIYADVNKDGAINISDLVVLRRQVVGTYNTLKDGFWRNVEIGKVNIYYGENDNYDAARKLELYLESIVTGVDINKVVVVSGDVAWGNQGSGTYVHDGNIAILDGGNGNTHRADKTADGGQVHITDENEIAKYALDGNLQIVVGDIGDNYAYESGVSYDKYEVTYNAENAALWVKGGSFTAVEQAVLDLISSDAFKNKGDLANADLPSGSILDLKANVGSYTVGSGFTTTPDAESYKSYRWVDKNSDGNEDDGELYYYAWGDEFESEQKTTFDSSEWLLKEYKTEDETVTENNDGTFTATSTETAYYLNLESANVEHTADLWAVENGRLTINRGVNTNATNIYTDLQNSIGKGYVATPLTTGAKNDYGSYVDENDLYVDPGAIETVGTMLFKYGYAEMRASLPSDGHAFPAWWILTGPAQSSNKGIETTLYDKIYTLNNGDNAWKYDGVSNGLNGANLSTYKYQIPAAHLEFDIVELMQAGATSATASDYRDYFQATVHRIYSENVYGNATNNIAYDNVLYIPNWKTGTSTAYGTYSVTKDSKGNVTGSGYASSSSDLCTDYVQNGMTLNYFKSANNKPYLNNYDNAKYNDLYPHADVSYTRTRTGNIGSFKYSFNYKMKSDVAASFSASLALAGLSTKTDITTDATSSYNNTYTGTGTYNGLSYSFGKASSSSGTVEFQNFDHSNLQKVYTYGFTWDADPSANTYTLGIYCDIDNDGIMEASTEKIFEINKSTGVSSSNFGSDPLLASDSATKHGQDDADLWNQYGYILLDNAFYTSANGGNTMFTSLGVDSNKKDKVTFDIEYVRVYQEDGKRDIITPETEDFNNGNHFGY